MMEELQLNANLLISTLSVASSITALISPFTHKSNHQASHLDSDWSVNSITYDMHFNSRAGQLLKIKSPHLNRSSLRT